jgi:micrococcal nuclease
VLVLSVAAVAGQSAVPAKDAAKHIGEKVTICDKVYGVRYFENGKDQPTLVNMGDAYPNNPFTFVIYGEDRKKFSWKPEEFLIDKAVCVTGEVKDYRGKPQIVVSDTAQLVIKK